MRVACIITALRAVPWTLLELQSKSPAVIKAVQASTGAVLVLAFALLGSRTLVFISC